MTSDQQSLPPKSGLSAFWTELKRRKVVRVAVAYIAVGWIITEVAATAFPRLGIPSWAESLILMLVILGFPIAVILAWAFQLTAEGIKVDSEVRTGGSVADSKGHKLNYITLGLVVLVLTFLVVDRYLFNNNPTSQIREPNVTTSGIKRTAINLENDQNIVLTDFRLASVVRRSLALSPDGTHLVYAVKVGDTSQLYLRRLDAFEAQPLKGTEGGFNPFFSPDGQWIGYLTPEKLMKISIRGGTPQLLTEASNVFGADWGPDDRIVFLERGIRQLSIISADGGEKLELVRGTFEDPEFLPDGNGILLRSYLYDHTSVVLYRMDTGETVTLIEGGAGPRYVSTGHILYTIDGGVSAIPFDLSTYTVRGPGVPVMDTVRIEKFGLPQLDFSEDGFLVYIPGKDIGIKTPVWVDRDGVEELIPLPAQPYGSFRLSPDDSKVAFLIRGQKGNDVWLYDFERATPPERLTTGGFKSPLLWNPDGSSILFGNYKHADRKGGIFNLPLNGSQETLIMDGDVYAYSLSSWAIEDLILYTMRQDEVTPGDIWVTDLDGVVGPRPLVSTSSNEWSASMSPDGRFFAYVSRESGQNQVYVKPYPPTESRWMVSAGLGSKAFWSAKGDEIFFLGSSQWMSVPVTTDPEFTFNIPRIALEGSYVNVGNLSYNVSSDGQRFLVLKPPEQPEPNKIHVVTNWFEELNSLVPGGKDGG